MCEGPGGGGCTDEVSSVAIPNHRLGGGSDPGPGNVRRPPGETPAGVQGWKPPPPPLTPRTSHRTLTPGPPPPAPRTSSSAGDDASSPHTAIAPGPRAAAGGGGGGHRIPLCTRPSLPSSGPRAGPPRGRPASRGARPPAWPANSHPALAVGPGDAPASWFPCLSPPQSGGLKALASQAPGDPRSLGRSSGASRGLRRIKGSGRLRARDQHRQQGGQGLGWAGGRG